jgi:chromosome partitioning protein
MCRIIAAANLKGGTGKSTLAVNFACFAATAGQKTLLVDADPQGTAATWLETADGGRPETLIVKAMSLGGGDPDAWADELFALAHRYSRMVIDMPPQLDHGTDAMLYLADAVVIPVTPLAIDLRATARTLQRVRHVQRSRDRRPACLLVPNRVDQRTAMGRTLQVALRDLDVQVAPPISQRAGHPMAFAAQQWIGAHAPETPASRELAAVAAHLDKLLVACPANDYRPGVLALTPAGEGTLASDAIDTSRPDLLAGLAINFRLLGRQLTGQEQSH